MIEKKVIPAYAKPAVIEAGAIGRLETIEALFARADLAESAARYAEDYSLDSISAWDIATR